MWVFGFGSLMWDGWHEQQGSTCRKKAQLIGYRRRFNKGSVINWGTKRQPGPTLNVEKGDGSSCQGIAFQFPDEKSATVLDYLRYREGKAFKLEDCDVVLDDGQEIIAIVPIYQGKNILNNSMEELASMAFEAKGKNGRCANYVLNIDKELKTHGFDDTEVSQLASLVKKKANAQQGR